MYSHFVFRFLAHGCSIQVLAWYFKMGVSTVRQIIYETCEAIWEDLGTIYVSTPNEYEWKKIANDFWEKHKTPNCVGAVDGKHINIVCPNNSGSSFYNYKKNYSIVLLASCDTNYTFTLVLEQTVAKVMAVYFLEVHLEDK